MTRERTSHGKKGRETRIGTKDKNRGGVEWNRKGDSGREIGENEEDQGKVEESTKEGKQRNGDRVS